MRYDLCYIDDRIVPIGGAVANENGLISKNELSGLIDHDEWEEPTVKKFLRHAIAKSNRYKQIELSGFKHPSFFLNHVIDSHYNPNSIILDWDYGDNKAKERIEEILERTASNIFVLTGNDLESEIEADLVELREKYNNNRIKQVFSKMVFKEEKNTQENLLEEIISDLSNKSEDVSFGGLTIKFFPSVFLPTSDRIWMLESILSHEYLISFIKENNSEISEKKIEELFEKSSLKFFINTTNTRIYSENGIPLHNYYEDKLLESPLTPIYALKNYDIAILETATEKGTSKIFENDER